MKHLSQASDLVTPHEQIRAGFVSLALERNRRSTPHIEEARALKAAVSHVSSPAQLLTLDDLRPALITAAGISDKAGSYMSDEDKIDAIKDLVHTFLEPAGVAWTEEVVYRFLLTRGDALGGSMRNVGGLLAKRRFMRQMIAALSLVKGKYHWLDSHNNDWLPTMPDDPDMESYVKGLSWSRKGGNRTIVMDAGIPFVHKNVDLCLMNCSAEQLSSAKSNPDTYLALGELKGGIDPAGADEHWKTAKTALSRIRSQFAASNANPRTFFLAAIIVSNMAADIWRELEDGVLANASNLTNQDQVASLCRWLIGL